MKNISKLLLILLSVPVLSADSSRSEKLEFFFTPLYVGSKSVDFTNDAGSGKADINSGTGLGFGVGYSLNEHFELSMLFASSTANYEVTGENADGEPIKDRASLYMSSFNLGATYNIIDGPLTPYVTGFFGATYVDSGVTTGDTDYDCNYYGGCYPYAETFDGTRFNYGASVGVRYDFENMVFLKAGVGKNWIDFDNSSSNSFIIYDLTMGIAF